MSETKVRLKFRLQVKEIAARLKPHQNVLLLGPLPVSKNLLLKVVKEFRPTVIIFVDGGQKHKKKLTPSKLFTGIDHFSLGDGDSGKKIPDFLLPKKKDYSDLAFALSCLSQTKTKVKEIQLLGFSDQSEMRPDHFLINIGEVENFVSRKKIPAILYRNDKNAGRLEIWPAGKNIFQCSTLFSLMTLKKNKIKCTGKVDFPLKKWTNLSVFSSLGLSNKGKGSVTIESTAPVILYFAGTKSN